jgi:hypothetical protein
MSRRWLVTVGATVTLAAAAFTADAATVRLKSRTITPTPDVSLLDEVAAGGTARHVLVQLGSTPSPGEREALATAGLRLVEYVPDHTWIARVTPSAAADPVLRSQVVWAGEILADDKLPVRWDEEGLDPRAMQPDGRVALRVRLHLDADRAQAADALRALDVEVVRGTGVLPGLEVLSPEWRVAEIAELDAVISVREMGGEIVISNDSNRVNTRVDAVNQAPYGLDGVGVRVAVWDNGRIDPNHDDFAGRLTVAEFADTEVHATHVGGTVGGSGVLSESRGGTPNQWRGMAPEVLLYCWYFDGDVPEEIEDGVGEYSFDVETNSWNWGVDEDNCSQYGDYDLWAPELDALVRGSGGRTITITHSAGNERDDGDCPLIDGQYGCIMAPATSKNVITVGATNSDDDTITGFSSYGPVDDGRVKPDVSAPGCERFGDGGVTSTVPGDDYNDLCGTSMATPTVAGVITLLRQLHMGIHGGGARPEPSMMKAILAATGVDLGNPGPDYAFGHGRVDAKAAADAMLEDTQHPLELSDDEVIEITFRVPSTLGALRVALAWDDPAASELAGITLINDLDLVLEAEDGTLFRPWTLDPANPGDDATRGEDHRNNLEQVTVAGPTAGLWTARVTGTNVPEGPQAASLVGLDFKSPPPPSDLQVVSTSEAAIELTWVTPETVDRRGTLLIRSTNPILWPGPAQGTELEVGDPAGLGATVIYVGDDDFSSDPFVDDDVVAGTRYYYAGYTFDDFHNHSFGATATGVAGAEVAVDPVGGAASFALGAARPNPARAATVVPFSVDVSGPVTLSVFDATGRRVRALVHGTLDAGRYEVRWDGTDAAGRAVSPGTYFYALRSGEREASGRIIWMR